MSCNTSAQVFPASSKSSLWGISTGDIPSLPCSPEPHHLKNLCLSVSAWFTVLYLLEILPKRNQNSTLPCAWTPHSKLASKPLDFKGRGMSGRHNCSDSGSRGWLHHLVILQQRYKQMPLTLVLLSFKEVFLIGKLSLFRGFFEASAWLWQWKNLSILILYWKCPVQTLQATSQSASNTCIQENSHSFYLGRCLTKTPTSVRPS